MNEIIDQPVDNNTNRTNNHRANVNIDNSRNNNDSDEDFLKFKSLEEIANENNFDPVV